MLRSSTSPLPLRSLTHNEVVYQVVLPVLSTGASLLAISTIAPEADNMLKQLVEAKDVHGKPIIKTINLEMVTVSYACVVPINY